MFTLPDLPYAYDALEPTIDAETMRLHHGKHHQAYVDKLNAALEGHTELLKLDITQLMGKLSAVPEEIRGTVGDNGGGHANHSFFWQIMSPEPSQPEGKLLEAINDQFRGFDKFKERFSAAGVGQFGSGWAWLLADGDKLEITSTPNQNNPWMDGQSPILGLDVWEHAYYLKYKNARPDYIKAWWKVVNWKEVTNRYESNVA